MFAPKKLAQVPSITENSELAPGEVARDLEILKRNELIAGDASTAQRVFDNSVTHTFKQGDQIIGEGEDKDYVFFLLFGEVEISREDKGKIDALSTPSSVGELAADTPGEPRTASVIVSSETLRTRLISGSAFREIRDSNPSFAASLHRLVGNMNRRKIAQKSENAEPGFFADVAKPLAIAVVCFLVSAALIYNFWKLSLGQNLSLSALAAIIVVGLSVYFDHQHRYGRAFSIALAFTLFYTSHLGVSYFFFVDGRSAPFPFFWNFSTNPEQSPTVAAGILLVLLLLCVVCGVLDHLRNSPNK